LRSLPIPFLLAARDTVLKKERKANTRSTKSSQLMWVRVTCKSFEMRRLRVQQKKQIPKDTFVAPIEVGIKTQAAKKKSSIISSSVATTVFFFTIAFSAQLIELCFKYAQLLG